MNCVTNLITVYIYYVKSKYEMFYGEILPIPYNIFAYTDKKKNAKLFEEQRDMKLFKKSKVEMTKAEYNELVRFMNDNNDRYIYIYTYEFYSKENNKMNKIDMAVTVAEARRIDNRKTMLEVNITKYCWTDPIIFNTEIKKALEILSYNKINKFIGYTVCDIFDENVPEYISDVVKINEIEIVLEVIGRTLKV